MFIEKIIASLLLLLLLPIGIVLSLIVKFNLGSPVIFKQDRIGLNGKKFTIFKFRTMIDSDDNDEFRLTKFGSFLRSTSLDEFPELWNIIKGDMSFVGPRPLLVEYLPLYDEFQSRRHNVKPGITGWAQINGRNSVSWEKKFEMDVWYVENQSFWLDLKILWKTIFKVINRDGISKDNHSTMPYFTGTVIKKNDK